MWEKSIEFTHTQTFFPESLLLVVLGRSPGLRPVILPSHRALADSGVKNNNRLSSLQLRVQLRYFT